MEERYCQSCGMPMGNTNELYGTERGRQQRALITVSTAIKTGCLPADVGMDEMVNFCVNPMVENNPGMTETAAREMMKKFFPVLKRWRA